MTNRSKPVLIICDANYRKFHHMVPSAATPQPNLIVSRKGAKAAKGELVISTYGRNLSQIPHIRSG